MPKTISANGVENDLSSVVEWVLENKDAVIVERSGEPAVVVLPYGDYEKVKDAVVQERHRQALERLRTLRNEVRALNTDITTDEEADALADRFVRDVVNDMVEDGRVRYEV